MFIFVFDVDGTLTPSRGRVDEDFLRFFLSFCERNKVYIVTGSDLPKTVEQIGKQAIHSCEGIFSCCGNEFWRKSKLVYRNKLKLSFHEKDILETMLHQSKFAPKTGIHVEKRSGMVNFSIVGRNATKHQRELYIEWDRKTNEREILAEKIRKMMPRLDCAIAGETGLDIYLKGNDKGQIYPFVFEEDKQLVFFGDRCEEGGNDYPIAMMADMSYNVQSWKDTEKILKEVYHEYC